MLARDGVVRLGHGWGFGQLLAAVSVRRRLLASTQPPTARAADVNLSAWVSERLDTLAWNSGSKIWRRHVDYRGAIPGLEPLLAAIRATVGKMASTYLGNDTSLDGYFALRLPPSLDVANYPAGYYHHDRCGPRLKFYVMLTRVTEGTHPLRVAFGSHRTLYYSHDDMRTSRFTDEFIEATYDVGSVTGEPGEGFLFDTNAVHKAGGMGTGFPADGVRDALVFEFNARGRSRAMCAVDHTLPCGCSEDSATTPRS